MIDVKKNEFSIAVLDGEGYHQALAKGIFLNRGNVAFHSDEGHTWLCAKTKEGELIPPYERQIAVMKRLFYTL